MNRPRIVISHRVFADTIQKLKPFGDIVAPRNAEALSLARLKRELALADAWMAFMPDSADGEFLGTCRRLRVIAGALKGYDNFDVAACTRHGIWISVVPDLLTVPTAELTIALMIGLARNLMIGDRKVRSGRFSGWRPAMYGTGIAGARVGFVGMGVIGKAIAERLRGFQVEQRYYDPRPLSQPEEEALSLRRSATLDDMLAWSDYVVLAASLKPETMHIINASTLRKIRRGCFLINPARGSLVDEDAVAAALEDGRLGGYAADTFELEDRALAGRPRTVSARLRGNRATLFSPHLGSAVTDVRRRIEHCAADSILDALTGRLPRNVLNPEARMASPE